MIFGEKGLFYVITSYLHLYLKAEVFPLMENTLEDILTFLMALFSGSI